MTMYLSNNEVGPTGYEGAEFIDVPVVADAAAAVAADLGSSGLAHRDDDQR